MQPDEIKTRRLRLLKITPELHTAIFETMDDGTIMELFGFDEKGFAKEKNRHAKGVTTFNKSFLYFLIKDTATQKTIGWCGYHTWYTDHDRAELGYGLYDDSFKQKGVMTEAVKAVLEYGFTAMNLHRVEAMTATYNIASQKTIAKFGFIYEGTLREHYLVEGRYEDSVLFSLLKDEFYK